MNSKKHEVRLVQDRDACIGHGSAGTVIYSTTLSKVNATRLHNKTSLQGHVVFLYT